MVFFGTPTAAVPSLAAVADRHEIVLAVTQPVRGRGSGRQRPVADAAEARGIPVIAPRRAGDAIAEIERCGARVAAVVAYGQILPPAVLDAFPVGMVNLHFSLLPRWRGAAPVEHAIWAGDEVTGVSTMVLDAGMDTGPLLHQEQVAIEPDERAGELTARLADIGAPLLVRSVEDLAAGRVAPRPQDEAAATTAPKVRPEQGRIDWRGDAEAIVRQVRAFHPRPGAFSAFRGRRLEVRRAAVGEPAGVPPGSLAGNPLRAAAGDRWVVLEEVQLGGRRTVPGDDFARGARLEPGEALG